MAALSACTITRLANETEGETCARLMAGSEPWLTLGRSYEACLAIIRVHKTFGPLTGFVPKARSTSPSLPGSGDGAP